MNKYKRRVDLAVLKYKDNSTSETEIVTNYTDLGILYDPGTGLWHCVHNKGWWGKTLLGDHQLYVMEQGVRINVNLGQPGNVICLFNRADSKQVAKMELIAIEATQQAA